MGCFSNLTLRSPLFVKRAFLGFVGKTKDPHIFFDVSVPTTYSLLSGSLVLTDFYKLWH